VNGTSHFTHLVDERLLRLPAIALLYMIWYTPIHHTLTGCSPNGL